MRRDERTPRQRDEHRDDQDVLVLVRHHLEMQGFELSSPDPPEVLRGRCVKAECELWQSSDEGIVHIAARPDASHHTYTLHRGMLREETITLPLALTRRELARGLTWIHPVDDPIRSLYLVDVLGELFVGLLERRAHILFGAIDPWPTHLLAALEQLCEQEDPWLAARLDFGRPRGDVWASMVSMGRVLRHSPMWSSSVARGRAHGLLCCCRDGLDERATQVIADAWVARVEHLEWLLESGARGRLPCMLREALAAASALLDWHGIPTRRDLDRIDALAVRQPPEPISPEPEVWRGWLLDGDVWWVAARG